ncbi:M48 family metalloprotease [Chelatococcus sp. SYSU_G07232]|uniref:M48 family metalloprotease n=1 Tax=Chelatococcus albus TaxID=3047466 RepID=A0ABT7ADF7_9HYPH|nr:M48 family metalloprotease [Chelatococcus sp. SYSU_G07232]MDJ1157409.1 M48 family metalloprotease [Chelatococcus sp. SYSU_G07232]
MSATVESAAWFLAMRRAAGALAIALLLAGCAGDGRGGLPSTAPLPPAAPRITGIERAATREHARLVAAFGGEYRAPALERMLADIVRRLTSATGEAGDAYRVTILNSPTVNAFALPSGNVYVTRGLLALANDTSELAGVLAHEIAHITARHALARAELEQRSALVSRVAAEVLNDPNAVRTVRDQSRLSIAGFSRAQELEADQISVRTIARAGYDPYGPARFLMSLGRNGSLKNNPSSPAGDFLSTHPTTPERIAQALVAARQIAPLASSAVDRAAYLAAVEGIAFGDDPSEGVVRGRRFLHPRLGITFAAPDGFTLDNTAQAVLGIGPGGTQALRLDAVEVPAGQTLEDYLASGWIDGLEPRSIESLTVNGLPAAVATARGKDWSFRLAVVRIDGAVYRLVLASRDAGGDSARAFRQTLDSLRRLSAEEARAVRPLRLGVAVARPGDTAEGLAARMAGVDRHLERFLVLNGLDRPGPLTAGEAYKIVME